MDMLVVRANEHGQNTECVRKSVRSSHQYFIKILAPECSTNNGAAARAVLL